MLFLSLYRWFTQGLRRVKYPEDETGYITRSPRFDEHNVEMTIPTYYIGDLNLHNHHPFLSRTLNTVLGLPLSASSGTLRHRSDTVESSFNVSIKLLPRPKIPNLHRVSNA